MTSRCLKIAMLAALAASTTLGPAGRGVAFAADGASPARETSDPHIIYEDQDRPAAVDYGGGVGVPRPGHDGRLLRRLVDRLLGKPASVADANEGASADTEAPVAATANVLAVSNAATSQPTVPTGGGSAGTLGVYAAAASWPIIPIHLALLPDGRVMSYGTSETGAQGAELIYDVWNPSLGTGTNSHMVLPNHTSTDLFCSGQSLLENGNVLLTGGDLTVNGKRNYSNNKTNIFNPTTNTLSPATAMQYPRWYPSIVPLPNGDRLVMGGRQAPYKSAILPEYYSATKGWHTLTGANSYDISEWYYPKSFVGPDGVIDLINTDGRIFKYTTAGNGTFTKLGFFAATGLYDLPSVMFAQGKVLSLRDDNVTDIVNLNATTPTVAKIANYPGGREWASTTLMADGQVLLNGGSTVANTLTGVSYTSYIFNPTTSRWTIAAAATKPRLYHSNAMLLPSGAVLTGGGGAPGPVNNLNVEIYYPPYLYTKDGSGKPAARPTISSATALIKAGGTIAVTMADATTMSRLTLLRTGAATHSTNLEQRFFSISFSQKSNVITGALPTNGNVLLPGYYMVFAFNAAGVPSVGKIVEVAAPAS